MFFTLSLLNTAIFWSDGSLDIGDLDIARIAEISFFLFLLPFTHYLDNAAENVLAEFSPILRASDDQYAALRYQLKTLPRRTGWLSIGLGLPRRD